MAKGRKLIYSRSEVLLGSYGYGGNTTIHDQDDDEELGEDDVWSMVDGMVNQGGHDWNSRATVETTPRRGYGNPIPRGGGGGGLSSALEESSPSTGKMVSSPRIVHHFLGGDGFGLPCGRQLATSAPVNVPDWSKIYRVESVESMHDSDDVTNDQDLDMVPPHEYLARSRGSSSVFVGAGRTLKGRDLSRVRDAVWSHTGFNG